MDSPHTQFTGGEAASEFGRVAVNTIKQKRIKDRANPEGNGHQRCKERGRRGLSIRDYIYACCRRIGYQ